MSINPFSFGIYARPRPRRMAFLVDADTCPSEQLDAIVEASLRMWGGRYNPVIPVQAGIVDDGYWDLLVFSDPDVIYTYVDLPADLLAKIDRQICPLQVKRHPERALQETPPFYRPYHANDQATCMSLVPRLLSDREGIFYGPHGPQLMLHRTRSDWPARSFALRNFGILQEDPGFRGYVEDRRAFPITNDRTDTQLLLELANTRNVIFPFQLAEYLSGFPEPANELGEEYCVVIGDDIPAWLYLWNRIFLLRPHLRREWNVLCLPPNRLTDDAFRVAANAFLRTYARDYGGGPTNIQIFYSNCPESEANEFAQQLLDGIYGPRAVHRLPIGYPNVVAPPNAFETFEEPATLYRRRLPVYPQQATGTPCLVQIPDTAIRGVDGRWMLDLKIEYRPERFSYTNQHYWWQLPKILGITYHFARNRPGRVSDEGVISLDAGQETNFEIQIPGDSVILWHLIAGARRPGFTDDIRPGEPPRFVEVPPSDKGRYNRGVIGLFGNLFQAGRFFGNQYWRSIFEFLSRRELQRENEMLSNLKNRIRKNRQVIINQLSKADEASLEWHARLIVGVAREQHFEGQEVSFLSLLDRLIVQREVFAWAHMDRHWEPSAERAKEDLTNVLQFLTDSQVFFQGVRISCTHCGSTFWYQVSELDQRLLCMGCRTGISLPVNAVWFYRLNNLVRNAIALHGCIPVVSALAELESDARTSFIFAPGLALYAQGGSRPSAELDIVCIRDGKFVIGEVKTAATEFSEGDLETLADNARSLQPHIVTIAAFHGDQSRMSRHCDFLRNQLRDTGIEIESWLPSIRYFETEYHI